MRDGLRLEVDDSAGTPPSRRAGTDGEVAGAPKRFPSSKLKLDELFLQWISLPDSQKLVLSLIDDAKAGNPLVGPHGTSAWPLSPSSTTALFSATPPLSPQKFSSPPRSPRSPAKKAAGPATPLPKGAAALPPFHFPDGPPLSPRKRAAADAQIAAAFAGKPLTAAAFVKVTKEVVELPSFVSGILFNKLDPTSSGVVSQQTFTAFWRGKLERADPSTALLDMGGKRLKGVGAARQRVFEVLRTGDADHLTHADLKPMMRVILDTHPGLEFLKEAPEFQERYAETVVYRIFYAVNRKGDRRLSLRELKRSDLVEAMLQVDAEEDINKILRYFSYEHFYVIYCKFWELDTDHDFFIDREDLLRYGNHALTYRIVDRIFSQAPRRFVSGVEGKMGYEDFCWFILSEEDKTSPMSLEYWFLCIDLDCDGGVAASEMRYFYEEQLHRMECLSQEPVLFEDILCQLHDMVKPAHAARFHLTDLKGCKLAGNFFNILFNLNKFIAFETRDPFVIRQEREDGHLTEWDRFARAEYVRLSMEEEGDDGGGTDMLEDSLDAPF